MMKLALLFIIISSTSAFSQYCKPYRDEPLKIGCTYNNCGRWTRGGLVKAARHHNTFIEIIDLAKNPDYKLTELDAIIIPGGADINPDYYINKVPGKWQEIIERFRHLTNVNEQSNIRDPLEYKIATEYFKNEKLKDTPFLGICRGMQMLTVSQAIPLYQDIKAELGIPNRMYRFDRVYVTDFNSLIYEIRKKKSFNGFQLHHQGLRMDYWLENQENHPNVRVTAVSNRKKVVEAIEFKNRPALGVQFHPELTFGKTRRRVFRWLINEACTKRELK